MVIGVETGNRLLSFPLPYVSATRPLCEHAARGDLPFALVDTLIFAHYQVTRFQFYSRAGAMKLSSATNFPSLPFSLLYLSVNILSQASVAHSQSTLSIASFDQTQDTNLSAACNAVYTETIPGCQMTDMLATNPCSSSCLNGLQTVQSAARSGCASDTVPSSSMLSYFQAGNGVNQLCVVMKNTATTMTTMVTSSVPSSPSSTSNSTSSASTNASGTNVPLVGTTSSGSPSPTAQANSGGLMGLPKIVLIGIVIGAVVFCALLVLMTYCCYNVHYKR